MTKYTCFKSLSTCGIFMLLVNLTLACDSQCACNSSCGFAYNVTHVSGYEHSNVTLHTSISHINISNMHIGHWIRYNYPVNSYALCTVSGENVASTKHDGWSFECNGTSLTLHNLSADQTGSYIFKKYPRTDGALYRHRATYSTAAGSSGDYRNQLLTYLFQRTLLAKRNHEDHNHDNDDAKDLNNYHY
ncbi:truncated Cy13.1 [Cynomolgus cytomegalovirus]|uniref:truncated Cy13.1 n=1 Tax=Cynomolgus cytomegalovirus TaxID=1919083 RepID=UPI0009507CE9|nr:truncated Cy13.1 [Cynomolgus cytomegalovirus]APT39579.1 truncated Cy13.1 [Cynomolgus cytomegalovirus]